MKPFALNVSASTELYSNMYNWKGRHKTEKTDMLGKLIYAKTKQFTSIIT